MQTTTTAPNARSTNQEVAMSTTTRAARLATIANDETLPASVRCDALFGRLPGETARRHTSGNVQQAWTGQQPSDDGLRRLRDAMAGSLWPTALRRAA